MCKPLCVLNGFLLNVLYIYIYFLLNNCLHDLDEKLCKLRLDLRSNFSGAYHDIYLTDTRVTPHRIIYCNDVTYFKNTYEQATCGSLYVGSCPQQG